MKPTHMYYNVSELIAKWSVYDSNINETDILKWGASGKLQFSVWISTGIYYEHIDIIQEYQDGTEIAEEGLLEGKEVLKHISCETIRIDKERKIWRLSQKSIEFLLDGKKKNTVFPELLLDCDDCENTQCDDTRTIRIQPTLAAWWLEKYPNYDPFHYDTGQEDPRFRYLYISKDDLVVSHEDMKQFEEEFFKPEVPIPPYLDPTHFAFNYQLALAIETWNALFIDKSHINEKTAKKAAQQYLKQYQNYTGDEEKYKVFSKKSATIDSAPLGKIAVMMHASFNNGVTWKEFKSKNDEQPPKA